MLHFPSTSGASNLPRRADSLNATQHKASSDPIFLKIEEELHDARRVQKHGQEDDLRYALNMVIDRVSQLTQMLAEAYKTQADLEVQLNVAKSNLQLVISNNEMLEDALRRDTSGSSKDVGWRRRTGRESLERTQSADLDAPMTPVSATSSPVPSASTAAQDNRFFKFRFNSSSASAASSKPTSRPSTPNGSGSTAAYHLTSPSMPTLPSQQAEKDVEKVKEKDREREEEKKKLSKELEELNAQLKTERDAKKAIAEEKALLEAELESLSQALFEEANKMVATERMKRAETEEELKQLQLEKEALKSALKVVEGENMHLRSTEPDLSTEHLPDSRSRSSSTTGVKSRPGSLVLPPLPPSPAPSSPVEDSPSQEEESSDTPRYQTATISSAFSSPSSRPMSAPPIDVDPWADVPPSAGAGENSTTPKTFAPEMRYT